MFLFVFQMQSISDLFLKVVAHPRYKQKPLTERIRRQITRHDAYYTDWSAWSPCSSQCWTERTRTCYDIPRCPAQVQQRQRKRCTCDIHRYLRNELYEENRRKYRRRGKSSRASYQRWREQFYEELVYDKLYEPWSSWSPCTRSCKMRRYRTCAMSDWCRDTVLMENRRCSVSDSRCDVEQAAAEANENQRRQRESRANIHVHVQQSHKKCAGLGFRLFVTV